MHGLGLPGQLLRLVGDVPWQGAWEPNGEDASHEWYLPTYLGTYLVTTTGPLEDPMFG